MDPYLRRLLTQTPLTADEEWQLARLARGGDAEARAALIVSGMRSVVQRALLLGLRDDLLRDGVQAGAIGLIRAVDRFDPARGVRLATYAWSWIGAALRTERQQEIGLVEDRPDPRLRDETWTWLDGLAPPMRDVVRLRFGDDVVPAMTRREVARRLDLSESRVRTIEAEAMRHLRGRLARIGHCAAPSGGADPP